jgi:hypothetical protein
MHRSGTSLVASLVGRLGVDLGRVIPADAHNPRGYFEDEDFLTLHREMLAAATPAGEEGHRDWGFAEKGAFDREALRAFAPRARALADERARAGRRWGFKDPRAAVLLDFWDAVLPGACFVLVYRPPWDVADSMQRLGAEVFLRHPGYAYAIWGWYNACLLDFRRRRRESTVLVCADGLTRDPAGLAALLAERLGLALEAPPVDGLVDRGLYRSLGPADPLVGLLERASPATASLLRELDAEADVPSAGHRGASPPPPRLRAGSVAEPSVSVVVPCHDDGEFLLEAVASAERSAPRGVELVVVDDGSSDRRTLEVLAVLEALGYRVERLAPRGLAAARNHGFRCARGRYVLPLDADNRLLPGFLEHAVEQLDARPEVGVVYGDWREFGGRNGPRVTGEFDLERLLVGNFIDACAVVRKAAWEGAGGYDEGLLALEDWELWIALAERGIGFARVDPGVLEATFEYRVRPGSLLSITRDEGTLNALLARIVARHAALYVERLPALVATALGSAPPQVRSMLVGAADETARAAREAGEALREARESLAETREALRREQEAARRLADSLRDAREAARRHEAVAVDQAATVAEILSSTSWRVSAPVRWVGRLVRRLRRRGRSARRQGELR